MAKKKAKAIAKGLPASPGAAVGKIVFHAEHTGHCPAHFPNSFPQLLHTKIESPIFFAIYYCIRGNYSSLLTNSFAYLDMTILRLDIIL